LRGKDHDIGFFPYSKTAEEFAELWAEHRDDIIEEHIAQWPGTRPYRWWDYDAPRIAVGTYPDCYYDGMRPEPRKRLGGIGTPCHECLAHVPHFSYGLPTAWVSQRDVERYTDTGRYGTFKGVAINPDDPPTYESQAAYLERHSLLLPGERKRLKKQDFEPEVVA
jgi:hypothetical protein